MRPIVLGIVSALFFAVTFIVNRAMSLSGGPWIWSASLRYLFMVPFLLLLVVGRNKLRPLLREMAGDWTQWILWSTVGFGLFYAPLCFAAVYGPGWLIAGTWQVTIISGSLLVPFFYHTVHTPTGPVKVRGRIPFRGLLFSLVILLGIVFMQIEQAGQVSVKDLWLGVLPVVVASFAYPLGNRKMMQICQGRLDTYQRLLGMTLASMPFWLLISFVGFATQGPPSPGQTVQSLLVAIASGVIATLLFFQATDMVKDNVHRLASVEATQSLEVLFAVAGELVILQGAVPGMWSWAGMLLVILGMILHSFRAHKSDPPLQVHSA